MLKLQEFIKEHPLNFQEFLSEKPYCIKMQEDKHFMLFKYSQIDSDFTNQLVRECRGIILDKNDWSIACHPFHKFGNYGESYVPEIDWDSAKVQEKLDGSLIKCWYNKYEDNFQWSTNGTIYASSANLQVPLNGFDNFDQLISYTLMSIGKTTVTSMMMKEYTYLFELCTPHNRVVVPHKDFELYHLSTKHNETGKEIIQILMMPVPKVYSLLTLEECIETANELPFNEEGYVVVDDKLNRVKIKSPAYLAIHHLKGEGIVSEKRALDLIRMNEHKEFLYYYDEYTDFFDDLEKRYNQFMEIIDYDLDEAKSFIHTKRKVFAHWANTYSVLPSACFQFYDGKIKTAKEAITNMTSERMLPHLKNVLILNMEGEIGKGL